jgi:uncharacterized protein (DUF1330 family)
MTTSLLAMVKIHDSTWVNEYMTNVPRILAKHGGEISVLSEMVKRYEGENPTPDVMVLFKFPSSEAVDAFVSDSEYAPFKEARRAGSSGELLAFTPRE